MTKPKISVVIPTLNEEKYIEQTLKSIKNQDYKGRVEIVVVDGGSKDRTVKIASKYADKTIVIGKGVAKERNTGAWATKSDLIVFVDADTILFYNTLSELEKDFDDRSVVASTCPVISTSPIVKDFIPYLVFSQMVKLSIKAKTSMISGCCIACRKDVFEHVGGFNEDMQTGEDFEFSKKLSKQGKIVFNERTFVMTSPRRLVKWGAGKSAAKYMEFYIKNHMIGRTVSMKEYGYIR
ncbi:MAG: glycosyltransferase [Candidatus Aenigmatarchaeota archaeon]